MKNKPEKNSMVIRSYNAEFRADEETGNTIIGRPIVYDQKTNLGYFEEVIERGALNGANLKDVLFFVNHDTSKIPLARSRNNNKSSTMQLRVDNNGLEIEAKLDVENNSEAKSLYSAISRGDITGMSFMFNIDEEEWENLDSDLPLRHIKKISIVREVSAVCFPAYEATSINARDKVALDNAKMTLDNVRATLDSGKNKSNDITLLKQKNQNIIDLF